MYSPLISNGNRWNNVHPGKNSYPSQYGVRVLLYMDTINTIDNVYTAPLEGDFIEFVVVCTLLEITAWGGTYSDRKMPGKNLKCIQ